MKSKSSEPQARLLKAALKSRDRTIMAIGYGRHNPWSEHFPSHSIASATALESRGLIVFVKKSRWGSVFKLTPDGQRYINSLDQ